MSGYWMWDGETVAVANQLLLNESSNILVSNIVLKNINYSLLKTSTITFCLFCAAIYSKGVEFLVHTNYLIKLNKITNSRLTIIFNI